MSACARRPIRIAIADDHPLMRAALRDAVTSQIEGTCVMEAPTLASLFDALREAPDTDAVLLDLKMPDSRGFSALVRLRTHHPDIPVIIVSAIEDADIVNQALLLGASGYLVKSASAEEVAHGVMNVLQGRLVRPTMRQSAAPVGDEVALQCRKLRTLTPAQLNVLLLIAEGANNKAVAGRLQISEGTVKAHITAILLKLGLQSRTQAAVLAQRSLQLTGPMAVDSDTSETYATAPAI
jgi:DNA-binding NarL/FixJ family response regulator